ncbi:2-phosphosulfolactate phosphatase [Trichocoleus sp. FACHB-262]|uniref:2-phosphosulfolactate phosphatase n=1 Tax=Trichocoleus sp. FACHB-262 TaxID=2692869 RepID=UPI001689CACB|nr:2-phosphosulfolactate phosphatase [Trichocoleus sp. FACHB-262]MBD2123637.1 2-phosphosulfolactate phosphatase [Trichocoleus sp. FACHB-262]
MNFFNQSHFEIRCEWGVRGVEQLAPISDVVIIVDVLSFSTCVEIATSRGAIVFPYLWNHDTAEAFAKSVDAELAGKRGSHSLYSLSPVSLSQIPCGTRLVLPSPNGSTLSLATGATPTLAGCLRNSRAVALAAMNYGQWIAVIPAGEKWQDGSLRPCWEDLVGAGAIISQLQGHCSPEAEMAVSAYRQAEPNLRCLLEKCGSGQELIGKGFAADVDLAAELNVSEAIATLRDRAYRCLVDSV